jgi:Cys-tRNA(Pro)/Cys-tRNA(Cys) deacylase
VTPAILAAERAKVAHRVLSYEHDPSAPAYGPEAAAALGLSPGSVFKTLVIALEGAPRPGALAVALVPVSHQLDLKAAARALGARRAAMADVAAAERSSGYVAGGISPLGQRKALPTVIDASALALAEVFVSAGRRGLEIALAPADLARLTNAVTAEIAKKNE